MSEDERERFVMENVFSIMDADSLGSLMATNPIFESDSRRDALIFNESSLKSRIGILFFISLIIQHIYISYMRYCSAVKIV